MVVPGTASSCRAARCREPRVPGRARAGGRGWRWLQGEAGLTAGLDADQGGKGTLAKEAEPAGSGRHRRPGPGWGLGGGMRLGGRQAAGGSGSR